MEFRTVVMMAQMGELMQEDIIADGLGKADQIEVEIDVAEGGAAAPVGGIVLDGHAIVAEAVSFGKETELDGEQGAGLIAEYLHKSLHEGGGEGRTVGDTRIMHLLAGDGAVKAEIKATGELDIFHEGRTDGNAERTGGIRQDTEGTRDSRRMLRRRYITDENNLGKEGPHHCPVMNGGYGHAVLFGLTQALSLTADSREHPVTLPEEEFHPVIIPHQPRDGDGDATDGMYPDA